VSRWDIWLLEDEHEQEHEHGFSISEFRLNRFLERGSDLGTRYPAIRARASMKIANPKPPPIADEKGPDVNAGSCRIES
jgi:hypothetical protein